MHVDTKTSKWATYNINELNESQSEGDLDLLSHVLHWSDELVVAPEEVPHQPLLVPRANSWTQNSPSEGENNKGSIIPGLALNIHYLNENILKTLKTIDGIVLLKVETNT